MTDASKTVWLVQADTATVGVYSSREQAMTERTGNEKAYEVEVDTCQIVPQTEWIVRFDLRSGEELEWLPQRVRLLTATHSQRFGRLIPTSAARRSNLLMLRAPLRG